MEFDFEEDVKVEDNFLDADDFEKNVFYTEEFQDYLNSAMRDLIVVKDAVEIDELEKRIDKAIVVLRKIDWVESGAKGLIEDAISILKGED